MDNINKDAKPIQIPVVPNVKNITLENQTKFNTNIPPKTWEEWYRLVGR